MTRPGLGVTRQPRGGGKAGREWSWTGRRDERSMCRRGMELSIPFGADSGSDEVIASTPLGGALLQIQGRQG